MGRVFSTQKFDLIRVSQYLMNGLKGGCKGLEYSKTPKIPLSLSTGMGSDTLIYHNLCRCHYILCTLLGIMSPGLRPGIRKCWILGLYPKVDRGVI